MSNTCSNQTCVGDCATPDAAAVCFNPDCPEQDIAKTACHFEKLPGCILCGACGRPCELRASTAPAR